MDQATNNDQGVIRELPYEDNPGGHDDIGDVVEVVDEEMEAEKGEVEQGGEEGSHSLAAGSASTGAHHRRTVSMDQRSMFVAKGKDAGAWALKDPVSLDAGLAASAHQLKAINYRFHYRELLFGIWRICKKM